MATTVSYLCKKFSNLTDMNQPDNFRDDLMGLLITLRTAQSLIQVLKDNQFAHDNDGYKSITRLTKEVFQKIDWYTGVSIRIMDDPDMNAALARADERMANIVNLVTQIANAKGEINEIDFAVNATYRREILFKAYSAGRADADFESWFARVFPNNISSPVKTNT